MVLLLVFMQLTRDLFAIAKFLFNVHRYRLDVRPSVTRWHCIKRAQHIVMLGELLNVRVELLGNG